MISHQVVIEDERDLSAVASDFLPGMSTMVTALIGIQTPRGDPRANIVAAALLDTMLDGAGPAVVERAIHNAVEYDDNIFIAYWLSEEGFETWWRSRAVRDWWHQALPDEIGLWREVLSSTADRHRYAGTSTPKVGPTKLLPVAPTKQVGHSGAYRERLAASATDLLASPLDRLPDPTNCASKGRRLSVQLPAGLCFIREGQTWDDVTGDELVLWDSRMAPVTANWVASLRDEPVATGCISIRHAREVSVASQQPLSRQSQFAFLLSLGHIEAAARTNPAHLALMREYIDMYANPHFAPRMNIWVEVHVPAAGGIIAEYVNCDPTTGFLPFFSSQPVTVEMDPSA